MTRRSIELNRAQVTVSPPGGGRITVLSGTTTLSDPSAPIHRQMLYQVFYEMYRRHPWVRAAVDKRAQVATASGYQLVPSDPQGVVPSSKVTEFRAFARRSNLTQLRRQSYKDIDIYSEAFWWVQRTRSGTPFKAFRLHPKYTNPRIIGGEIAVVEYGTANDSSLIHYPYEDVLHFRDEDPDQDVAGLSKMFSLMDTVSQDLYAMRYNLSFFENSAQTGIIFNMRNASREEAERNRVWLEQNYAGPEKAHRPIVLEGDIQVQKSVATKQEMEWVAGRKVNRQEILAVLDVPETILGMVEDSNRSNSKENDLAFRDAISGRQTLVEEEINNKLLLGMFGWDDVLFEENESSKRGQLEQAALLIQLLQNGLFNRDEIRGMLGRGDIEGGDVYTVQTSTGIVPVDRLLDQPQQPAGDPPPPPPVNEQNPNAAQKREDRRREVDARRR